MRIIIHFHGCTLRVDVRKTGFNAHSIRIRGYVCGQASGLQQNYLPLGSPWPGACQTDYPLLSAIITFCDLIADWTRPNPGAGAETVYQCYQTLSALPNIK